MTTKSKVKEMRDYFASINNCGSNSITQVNAMWLIEQLESYIETVDMIKEDLKDLRQGLDGHSEG